MLEKYRDVMTLTEFCEALHIGKNKAYKLIRSNVIKSKKIGEQYRILKISVIEYLNS
ncbi:MAG: helix-turn-helix domain-containing protein [Clostridia bacterium]